MSPVIGCLTIDRMLVLAVAILSAATLMAATDAHAFCTLFCIHGERMVQPEICIGQAPDDSRSH